MTRVKICGLTRVEDVRLAVSGGAWACGFVLTDSPRRVSPEHARVLAAEAAGAVTVGVFTTEPVGEIVAALRDAGLAAVQLSAGLEGSSVDDLLVACEIMGVPRPLVIAAADTSDVWAADMVLFDARTTGGYGGTGLTLNWPAVATVARGRFRRTPVVLAGGLTPSNVSEAVGIVEPFAVDVCSGVESTPGVKDQALLAAFLAACAAGDPRPVDGAASTGDPATQNGAAPANRPAQGTTTSTSGHDEAGASDGKGTL